MENPIIDETNTTTDNTQKDENLDGLLKDIKSFKDLEILWKVGCIVWRKQ